MATSIVVCACPRGDEGDVGGAKLKVAEAVLDALDKELRVQEDLVAEKRKVLDAAVRASGDFR